MAALIHGGPGNRSPSGINTPSHAPQQLIGVNVADSTQTYTIHAHKYQTNIQGGGVKIVSVINKHPLELSRETELINHCRKLHRVLLTYVCKGDKRRLQMFSSSKPTDVSSCNASADLAGSLSMLSDVWKLRSETIAGMQGC